MYMGKCPSLWFVGLGCLRKNEIRAHFWTDLVLD